MKKNCFFTCNDHITKLFAERRHIHRTRETRAEQGWLFCKSILFPQTNCADDNKKGIFLVLLAVPCVVIVFSLQENLIKEQEQVYKRDCCRYLCIGSQSEQLQQFVECINMSYNGIGLPSAKGSSTSGHIQRSLASSNERDNIKRKSYLLRQSEARDKKQTKKIRKPVRVVPNKRNDLRDIELQVSELRDKLEDDMDDDHTITQESIDDRCKKLREQLLKDMKVRTAYTNRQERDCNGKNNDVNHEKLEY